MHKKKSRQSKQSGYTKYALFLTCVILLTALACLLWIVRRTSLESDPMGSSYPMGGTYPMACSYPMACIYQDGVLIKNIPLDPLAEPYSFTVTGDGDCFNEITVKGGSIGVTAASCPDKICMHQGFISTSLLPVTCLPNRLVIQIRPETDQDQDALKPDIITY